MHTDGVLGRRTAATAAVHQGCARKRKGAFKYPTERVPARRRVKERVQGQTSKGNGDDDDICFHW